MPAGRPPIEINEDELFKLAAMHCTMKEIAAFFGCSVETLRNNYLAIIDKGREQGKIKLRRLQLQAAEKGNVVMLIWLGKNLLDQSDKQEIKSETNVSLKDTNVLRDELRRVMSLEK